MTEPRAPTAPQDDLVLILDFGAQYARLIARRVREAHVYCEIVPFDITAAKIRERGAKALILSGGPESVLEDGSPGVDPGIWDLGVPILGICYGMQLMARDMGGEVHPGLTAEFGRTEIERVGESPLFGDLGEHLVAWMSHRDTVAVPPEGFTAIARSQKIPVAAMQDPGRGMYGIQFHAEVTHTPWGSDLIRRFVLEISGCKSTWTAESVAKMAIRNIRRQVGEERVLCALSGGVDSVTVAVLLHKAIGDKVVCVFIDHGLLRQDERVEVETAFKVFDIPLHVVDASDRFLGDLEGVVDPEDKRKAIGTTFVRVFEEFAGRYQDVHYLAQGTLYPDVIESQSGSHGPGAKIKSHHNVGGLPEEMGFQDLVEPLRYLFKDEVREVALEIGVPRHMAFRQPFPGPGLAIRIVGTVTPERLEILRLADAIVREEVENSILDGEELWQYFAVLPAVKTVGVTGDHRNYGYVAAIRCVTSTDGMTSDFPELPWPLIRRMSNRIMNEVEGISRVVYDVSTKPPATIEWE